MHPGIRISLKRWQLVVAALTWTAVSAAIGAEPDNEPPPLKVPQANREPRPLFVPAEYPMPGNAAAGAGAYQMRCWQRGQLLFTENNLSDPVIAALPGRVATFNEKTGNAAVYLVEVADSLCLIKRR